MKEIPRFWSVVAVLSLLFFATGLLFQECHASQLITFEGAFLQQPELPPYPDDTVTHKFDIKKDGIITVTVIFDPIDLRYEDEIRKVLTTIHRPKDLCEINRRKSVFYKFAESGEIYGGFPIAAGQYEIELWPRHAYMIKDGSDSSYTVYINYTMSDPSTDDLDSCIDSHDWGCPPNQFEDWGTLTHESKHYSHLGYTGCLTDHEDYFHFKVSKTGKYYFHLDSGQIDVTKCSDKSKYRGRFNKLSGFPHWSFFVYTLDGNKGYLNEQIGPLNLVKGEQYELTLSAYGPDFDTQHCFAAVKFQLIRDYKPVTVEQVQHSENTVCGITEEITITIKNPNDVDIRENVLCEMKCVPDKTFVVRDLVLLPAGKSTNVKLSWDIPRDLLTGRCNISCGVDYAIESNMDVLCDKLPPIGSIYMLLKNVFGSHD